MRTTFEKTDGSLCDEKMLLRHQKDSYVKDLFQRNEMIYIC